MKYQVTYVRDILLGTTDDYGSKVRTKAIFTVIDDYGLVVGWRS